ncbi:hypothetical protein EST35_0459 [Pseudomonas phage vB_PaeM_PA5oct]|uniref:Uncharacterized protein n=1 Tax=Pseudomonas phage vB_PaeM_PA5oct TaxID=2163605 RepID=A0A4Y5JUH9_9CAUD|nr:hypothetical protein PQE65_gp038 [Pseudomonas phage vB_PaeM_PA5oct]QCG76327.1 hypothetical protein EST35_0459 [Pseudomonas phage vB_PaeM_PA5oct]
MNLIYTLQHKTRYITQFDTTYRLINSGGKGFYLITRKNKKTIVDIDYNAFNDIFGILHLQSKTHILKRSYYLIKIYDVYTDLIFFYIPPYP